MKLYRIRPDNPPRERRLPIIPATCPEQVKPNGGKEILRFNSAWMAFVAALNSEGKAWRFLQEPAAGWFLNGYARPHTIAWQWNVVEVDETDRKYAGWSRINTWPLSVTPVNIGYQNTPHLVHRFTCTDPHAQQRRPGDGSFHAYVVITSSVPVYVQTKLLEPFPGLNKRVWILKATPAHKLPDVSSPVRKTFYPVVNRPLVTEYACRGGDVWGRTWAGWILLTSNTTTWKMTTDSPLP